MEEYYHNGYFYLYTFFSLSVISEASMNEINDMRCLVAVTGLLISMTPSPQQLINAGGRTQKPELTDSRNVPHVYIFMKNHPHSERQVPRGYLSVLPGTPNVNVPSKVRRRSSRPNYET